MMERERLGKLIQGIMGRHDLERSMRQRAALSVWPEVVGADIARNAWPLEVRGGVMRVGASNHAWAQTLHLMRTQILEALNERVGEDILRDLQVRVGGHRPHARHPAEPDSANRPPLPPLSAEEQQRVRDLAGGIHDPELRARVERAIAGLMRLRRLRQLQGWRKCPRCGGSFASPGRTCPACAGRR